MLQKLNSIIARNGLWIFMGAATYKFVFWVINISTAFANEYTKVGSDLKVLFGGLIDMAWELLILAVILEVSRKIASGYAANANYNPQMPVQPNNAVPTPANNGAWFCTGCGTQNNGASSFCSKCGKPK